MRTLLPVGVAGAGALVAVGVVLGRSQVCGRPWWMFAMPALAIWCFLLASLSRYLTVDRAVGARGEVTLATAVTLLRGLLVSVVAGLAGFASCSWAVMWGAAFSYTTSAMLDSVDGAVARRTGRITRSGARLDSLTDAAGLLVASACAVAGHQLPPWYLLVGLAYPALQLSLSWRERSGLPVHRERLRPYPPARAMAGAQMALVAVSLCPVVPVQIIWPVSTLMMVPTLWMFARDWRVATRDS